MLLLGAAMSLNVSNVILARTESPDYRFKENFERVFIKNHSFEQKFFVDQTQQIFSCCGIDSYHDYLNVSDLPVSCCVRLTNGKCSGENGDGSIHRSGCLKEFIDFWQITKKTNFVAKQGVFLLEILAFMLTFYLAKQSNEAAADMRVMTIPGKPSTY